jgi:hypothetical protein
LLIPPKKNNYMKKWLRLCHLIQGKPGPNMAMV